MKRFLLSLFLAAMMATPVFARPSGYRTGPVITNGIKQTTVSGLPAGTFGLIYAISDGASTTDCTTGGGANPVVCWYNGTAWTAIVSSGATDLTSANTWTTGDGVSGDVCFVYDGDGGTDLQFCSDVSEDAFTMSGVLKFYSDSALDSSGLLDDAGDAGFDISHWDTGRGTILVYDGTGIMGLVGIQISDTCNPGERPSYNSGGTWTCEVDADTGAPTIGDTYVAYATSANTIGGEAAFYYDDATNTLYVGSLATAATALPTIALYDSDATAGDINVQIVSNCTDVGDGTEDCDITFSQQIAGAMTAFLTADADGSVTIERLAATTHFILPYGTNPTTDADGEIAFDSDDEAIEIYDGTTSRLIPSMQHLTRTIYDPDTIQAVEDAIPLMEVLAEWAPHGITIVDIELSADASNSGTYALEEWTSPTDGSPSTIESITFSAATEAADDGTLTDASIAAGSFVFIDLDTTALNFLTVTFTYYINEGD